MEDIDQSSLRQLMIVMCVLFYLGPQVNATLVYTCTSWHETILVLILVNQK